MNVHRFLQASTLALLWTTSQAHWNGTSQLRGGGQRFDERSLVSEHTNFVPLPCNEPVCNAGRSLWSKEGFNTRNTVVIPCGKCVTMDHASPTLVLPNGLDIRGMLLFPDGYKLQIETPFVRVQGHLHMKATNPVTGNPNIRILLTGDSDTSFVPASRNRWACSPSTSGEPQACIVGRKPIVVAGGHLDLQGLPDNCKTWVRLQALTDIDPPDPPPPSVCEGNLIENGDAEAGGTDPSPMKNFGEGELSVQTSGTGNSFFRIASRESQTDSVAYTLPSPDCMVAGSKYSVSAKVRVKSDDFVRTLMVLRAFLKSGSEVRYVMGDCPESRRNFVDCASEFVLPSDFPSRDVDSVQLSFETVNSSHVFEVDNWGMELVELAQEECVLEENLIRNGDAEDSETDPSPMENFGEGELTVQTSGTGNSFFRIASRRSQTDSVAYTLPSPNCMVARSKYSVSASVRVKSDDLVRTLMVLRAFLKSGSEVRYVMGECPESRRNFVDCASEFVLPSDFPSSDVDSVQLSFETVNSSRVFEVDNWGMELVELAQEECVLEGNLIRNGDAEASDTDPSPMENLGRGELSVQTSGTGNSYFRTESRERQTDSVAYHLPSPECMVAGGKYSVSARVRVKSNTAVRTLMVLRASFKSGSPMRILMGQCPRSRRVFVDCASEFELPSDFPSNDVDSIRLSFETVNSVDMFEVDDWIMEFADGSKASIIVQEDGVSGCWDSGAQILITSHTTDFESAQVRRLVSTPENLGNGFVRLHLNEEIAPPVSVQDGDGFAVEVALLNRNIVFEGDTDEDPLIGGHLIVLNTPKVSQRIEGVELINFGRQGELGRYPIHFHMCGDVDGALVSKNSIRDSKQRCVVVHGTHNLTVLENVAYETKGHCYITEDGGELDNRFIRNLGASTRAAREIVRSFETDAESPSTFWCSNPANEWIGNVAAGSESNGFWFELQEAVRSPTALMPLSVGMIPRSMPLKRFVDNVAHSNRRTGLRTYPLGFRPPMQSTFDNTLSYKNRLEGFFIHNTDNILFEGGAVADNGLGLDLDRADDITVDGMQVVGITERYQAIVISQAEAPRLPAAIRGLELHSFTTDKTHQGATIRNVRFSGFSSVGEASALVQVDDDKWSGSFDYWTTFGGVQVVGDVTPLQFDFAKAASTGITNVYFTDLDSGMKPSSITSTTGPSTVLSNSDEMTAFLDVRLCEEFPERGYLYCVNTCLRTVTFATDPAETENYSLVVTDMIDNRSFVFPGRYHYETLDNGDLDESRNTGLRKRRYFTPVLPPGEYEAHFLSGRTTVAGWPRFVETTFSPVQCDDGLEVGDMELVVPAASRQQCQDLINNGYMEQSTDSYPHWLHRDSGIELVLGEGIRGSAAIVDPLDATDRGSIAQYMDTRCLTVGAQFDVRVWVRLERGNGSNVACDGNNCPSVKLRVRQAMDAEGTDFSEGEVPITSSFVRPFDTNGWNLLQAVLTVDSRVAAADSVALSVERGTTNIRMFLDDVSVTLIDHDCRDLVFNGDLSLESKSLFWDKEGSTGSTLEMRDFGGDPALALTSRSSVGDEIVQQVRVGCMRQNDRFIVHARFRLFNGNGSIFRCNPNSRAASRACPRMRLRAFSNPGQRSQVVTNHPGGSVAEADHGVDRDGWNTISGIFTATLEDELAERSVLSFIEAPSGKDLVIDDVSISLSPVPPCTELLSNGDAEAGDTARFWRNIGPGDNTSIQVVGRNGSQVFQVSKRSSVADGLQQAIDPSCLSNGSKWKLTGQMRLESIAEGKFVKCDPRDDRVNFDACPPIIIMGFQAGGEKVEEKFRMTNRPEWVANDFNDYQVEFEISKEIAACDRVSFAIRTYNSDWVLYLDNLSLSPA